MARLPIRFLLAAVLCVNQGATALAQPDALPTFALVARDGRLSPERIEVPAGKKIKLTIRNEGPGPIEFENLDLRIEKVLAPGASSFVVIHPLQAGSYRFIDEFHAATGSMQIIAK